MRIENVLVSAMTTLVVLAIFVLFKLRKIKKKKPLDERSSSTDIQQFVDEVYREFSTKNIVEELYNRSYDESIKPYDWTITGRIWTLYQDHMRSSKDLPIFKACVKELAIGYLANRKDWDSVFHLVVGYWRDIAKDDVMKEVIQEVFSESERHIDEMYSRAVGKIDPSTLYDQRIDMMKVGFRFSNKKVK